MDRFWITCTWLCENLKGTLLLYVSAFGNWYRRTTYARHERLAATSGRQGVRDIGLTKPGFQTMVSSKLSATLAYKMKDIHTLRKLLTLSLAFVLGVIASSVASRPILLSGNEDQSPVEVRCGKLDAYSDGNPRGTLVKWPMVKTLAPIVGHSEIIDHKNKRLYIERFAVWWPPIKGSLHSSSSVWIAAGNERHSDSYEIMMRDGQGNFVTVGKAQMGESKIADLGSTNP